MFPLGDSKQSNYRFCRADFCIFPSAADWLVERLAAQRLARDLISRKAPAVATVVNERFARAPALVGFWPRAGRLGTLPGRVELLPQGGDDSHDDGDAALALAATALRDPCRQAPVLPENLRRRAEPPLLAARIVEMVWRLAVETPAVRQALLFASGELRELG